MHTAPRLIVGRTSETHLQNRKSHVHEVRVEFHALAALLRVLSLLHTQLLVRIKPFLIQRYKIFNGHTHLTHNTLALNDSL